MSANGLEKTNECGLRRSVLRELRILAPRVAVPDAFSMIPLFFVKNCYPVPVQGFIIPINCGNNRCYKDTSTRGCQSVGPNTQCQIPCVPSSSFLLFRHNNTRYSTRSRCVPCQSLTDSRGRMRLAFPYSSSSFLHWGLARGAYQREESEISELGKWNGEFWLVMMTVTGHWLSAFGHTDR